MLMIMSSVNHYTRLCAQAVVSMADGTETSRQKDEVCVDCAPGDQSGGDSHDQPISSNAPQAFTSETILDAEATRETIIPPTPDSLHPSILIEYCDRCRWAPRATWTQTELFLTFPTPTLKSITLQPLTAPDTAGRFRVWLYTNDGVQILWDRKREGGFPELKVLKQRVRDVLQPGLHLGHSDKSGKTAEHAA
ncbi:Rdx family-domain-containing protein [Kockovaella imperatae]|uniref:Rdx family-domain-containing protein n=1 Tax=Kockovaella imperatae TaxID=4999 RepID=A0A1Y1U8P1_9TREE|nr:Rdx family-domain-containing protein [Kockovaella imperatae]ORX33866.1 Rdx family-domain-containing protein [Kockovaella imperatae]